MDGKGAWRSEARKIPSRGGGTGLRRGKGSIFTEIGGKGEGWGGIDKCVGGREEIESILD